MEVFHLGQKVEVMKGYIPADDLLPDNQSYYIIGMRKRKSALGFSSKQFLILLPKEFKSHGWNLMGSMSSFERESYGISKDDWVPDNHCYWVSETALKHPDRITKVDGAQCAKCKDFVYMAKPNSGFVCRPCILDPYRCSPPAWQSED